MEILDHFAIRDYFSKIITRENYDPEEKGLYKNISEYDIEILIDDDIGEIKYNLSKGKIAILVSTYRKNNKVNKNELNKIMQKYKL